MQGLIEEVWGKTKLAYISDLKEKNTDIEIEKFLKEISIDKYDFSEWKDLFAYLGFELIHITSIQDVICEINNA